MHLIFTDEELDNIYTRKFGWPIKDKCPQNIRESIERKKKLLEDQKRGD